MMPIPEEIWRNCLMEIHKCSNNAGDHLIQFIIIHRLYYSKQKLHNILPQMLPICDKFHTSVATLLHCFALCPKSYTQSGMIYLYISKVINIVLEPEPLLLILNVLEIQKNLRRAHFLWHCLITV